MDERRPEKDYGNERRSHPREKIKIRVQYKNIEKFKEEWAENISHGGIFIKSANTLALHTDVEISLYLPNEERPITLIGEVVRTVTQQEADARGGHPGFALEFKDFSAKKRELDDFIEKTTHVGPGSTEPVIRLGPPDEETAAPDAEAPGEQPIEQSLEADEPERVELKVIQIKNMSVKDKMILAPKADKTERAVLLRDLNASVARLLIRNPRIGDSEIAQIAKDFSAPADVLEAIVKNRKWIQNPEIRLAIVKNPRTPTPLALNQLNYIQVKDLAFIAKSQHVRETIKNEALKLLLKKRDTAR